MSARQPCRQDGVLGSADFGPGPDVEWGDSCAPQGDEDIVTAWRRRLPLAMILTGSSKGRSIKALREKMERLSSKPATLDDGNRLRQYLKKVLLAQSLRPDKVAQLPTNEVEAALHAILSEGVALPPEVGLGLVDRRIGELLHSSDMAGLLATTRPWPASPADKKFDPFLPKLGPLRLAVVDRIAKFKQNFWYQGLIPCLMTGEQGLDRVVRICELVKKEFESEDVIDLDVPAAQLVQECMAISTGLIGLVRMETSTEVQLSIILINSRKGGLDKSLTTSIANAVYGNGLLESKINVLIKGAAVIEQYGERVEAHTVDLETIQDAPLMEKFSKLNDMCSDLSSIRSTTSAALFDRFAAKLLVCLLAEWDRTKSAMETKSIDIEMGFMDLLQKLGSEASMCFSLEEGVHRMQAEIAAFVQAAAGTARVDSLRQVLKSHIEFDIESDLFDGALEKLNGELALSQGVAFKDAGLDSDFNMTASGLAASFMGAVSEQNHNKRCDAILDVMERLNTFVALSPTNLVWLQGARALTDLVSKRRAPPPNVTLKDLEDEQMAMTEFLQVVEKVTALKQRVSESGDGGIIAKLVGLMNDAIDSSRRMVKEYGLSLVAKRMEKLQSCLLQCRSAAENIHLMAPPWYACARGTGPSAWEALGNASERIKNIDCKKLEGLLGVAAYQLHLARGAMAFAPDASDSEQEQHNIEKELNTISIQLHIILVYWHLCEETDKDALRKKVQREIKALRMCAVKEKEILPACMFKRAWESITCAM